MIDPITAITAATAAFNTVKKFVHAGQDFENCMGQMGKWYAGVSDFRKGQQLQKNPPIFRMNLNNFNVRFGPTDRSKYTMPKNAGKHLLMALLLLYYWGQWFVR